MHIYDGNGRSIVLDSDRETVAYLMSLATEALDCNQETGRWTREADKCMANPDVV